LVEGETAIYKIKGAIKQHSMKKLASCFLITQIALTAFAQPDQKAFFGFGIGLDYGGIGIKAELQPAPRIGIFGGFGFNLDRPAFNAGISYSFLTEERAQPFITAMYGYNAVLLVVDDPVYNKTFYGFTAGAGCNLFNKQRKNKFTLDLLVPFRTQAFNDYYTKLKNHPYIYFEQDVLPVTFTIGYNFLINNKKTIQ